MKPTTPLKLGAIAFAVLWFGWMAFASRELNTLAITGVCAVIAGWLWYRIMRWCFRVMRLLPDSDTAR